MKLRAWEEWTDEEILAEIRKVKTQGHGSLTIEVFEHKVREVTPAPRLRKLAPVRPVEKTARG